MRKSAITSAAIALAALTCFGPAHAGEPTPTNQITSAPTEPCAGVVEELVQAHWPAQIPSDDDGGLPNFEGVFDAAVGTPACEPRERSLDGAICASVGTLDFVQPQK